MKSLFLALGAILVGSTAMAGDMDLTSPLYTSELLVWLFLGFCSMIVVLQLVPAIMLLVGMVKGLVAAPKATTQIQ